VQKKRNKWLLFFKLKPKWCLWSPLSAHVDK